MSDSFQSVSAENDFYRARRKASISAMFAKMRGESSDLLSYEEVKGLLRPQDESYRGQKTIKIADIVGSEGRYRDFDRHFLPRNANTRHRWQSISTAHERDIGLPAIRVYELNGVYFIRDGNHRVSVAKSRGGEFIEAEITSLTPTISVGPFYDQAELKRAVIEYERGQFLEALDLIDSPQHARIRFTATGRYDDLVLHITCHKRLLEQRNDSQTSFRDATNSWYQSIYLPMTKLVRDSGVLGILPDRTEADFYVWLIRHWDDMGSLFDGNISQRKRLQRRFSSNFKK